MELLRKRSEGCGGGATPTGGPFGAQRVCRSDVDVEDVLVVGLSTADKPTSRAQWDERERLELVLECLPGGDSRIDGAAGVVSAYDPSQRRIARSTVAAPPRAARNARLSSAVASGRCSATVPALKMRLFIPVNEGRFASVAARWPGTRRGTTGRPPAPTPGRFRVRLAKEACSSW